MSSHDEIAAIEGQKHRKPVGASMSSVRQAAQDVLNTILAAMDSVVPNKDTVKALANVGLGLQHVAKEFPPKSPEAAAINKVKGAIAMAKIGKLEQAHKEITTFLGISPAVGVHKPTGDVAQIKPGSHKVDNVS